MCGGEVVRWECGDEVHGDEMVNHNTVHLHTALTQRETLANQQCLTSSHTNCPLSCFSALAPHTTDTVHIMGALYLELKYFFAQCFLKVYKVFST